MLSLVVTLVVLAPEIPPECQAPPARDVSSLASFAQTCGSLSVGLDSIATWCFDSDGAWSGGNAAVKGKKPPTNAAPTGDCAKAIASCESARAAIPAEQRQLLFDALGDLEKPFLGVKYKPKRSGLAERPPEVADCNAHDRSTLFSHAQARMDLARLASQVQSEYANFRTWLFAEGLKCAQAVARGEKDFLQKRVAIDTPVQGGGTQTIPSGSGTTGGGTTGTAASGGVALGSTGTGTGTGASGVGSTTGGGTTGGGALGGTTGGGTTGGGALGGTTGGGTTGTGAKAGSTGAGTTLGSATGGGTTGGGTTGTGGTTGGGTTGGGTT
ncbi:MAG: hypothetical protein ACOZQL_16440, partial [Myxococcota bacterium]